MGLVKKPPLRVWQLFQNREPTPVPEPEPVVVESEPSNESHRGLTPPPVMDENKNHTETAFMNEDTQSLVGAMAKTIAGAGLLGLLLWKTPLFECLMLSVYIVVIPALFLTSVGLIGQGTLTFLFSGADSMRDRIDIHLAHLRAEQAAAPAAEAGKAAA